MLLPLFMYMVLYILKITSGGKDIKYGSEILELLEPVWAPKKVAVMHCPGQQKCKTLVALGNWRADQKLVQWLSGLHSLRL
jgi:hypothetical protein